MADVKISSLPASTVPLAGTEVLPIVQSATTKQVSVANLTAGRTVTALSVVTPTIQAEAGSAGGTIKNGSGVAQMQWGSGGGSNLSLEVATNINPANAAVNISPTGTGTVTISPAVASSMNNVAIGGTTPLAGKFTTLEATGVTTVQAGSVSAPAITTTGDTNTGIFFPAADTIAFTEGGAESMRIYSSGGVSIGNTTDPGATNLSVTGDVIANSKVLINGTTNTDTAYFVINGNNLVNASFSTNISGGFNQIIFRNPNGVVGSIVTNGTATSYNVASDSRLKTNIKAAPSAIQSILDFPVEQFDWISNNEHQNFGAIAQKIVSIIPEMVSVPDNPNELLGMDWSKAVPRLIKAFQEQQLIIEQLQKKVNL